MIGTENPSTRRAVGVSRPVLRILFLLTSLSFVALSSPLSAKETLVKDVAEFDAAVKAAQPGDEIVMADGEWRDADLRFRGSGIEDRTITLRAQTPGKVVLLGTSRLRIGGEFLLARDLLWRDAASVDDVVAFRIDSKTLARRCTLYDCAILGDVPDIGERKFVSIYGQGNAVAQCRFEGKQSGGTLLVVWLSADGPESFNQIGRNFFGPRERLGKNGGEIIRIGDSKTSMQRSSTKVDGNYFYGCSGEAEIISNKSGDNVYVANVFVGCGGALTLRHGNHCVVSRNLFFGDGQKGIGGVRVIGEGHEVSDNLFYHLTGDEGRAALSLMNGLPDSPLNGYFQVKAARIRGNDFIGCKQSILIGSSDKDQKKQTLPPIDCILEYNSVTSMGTPIVTIRTPPESLKCSENRYAGGELGLSDATGWKPLEKPITEMSKESLLERMNALPSEVGPKWMRPGDEYLPEVLKPAKSAK